MSINFIDLLDDVGEFVLGFFRCSIVKRFHSFNRDQVSIHQLSNQSLVLPFVLNSISRVFEMSSLSVLGLDVPDSHSGSIGLVNYVELDDDTRHVFLVPFPDNVSTPSSLEVPSSPF